jgi:hypothetical protein
LPDNKEGVIDRFDKNNRHPSRNLEEPILLFSIQSDFFHQMTFQGGWIAIRSYKYQKTKRNKSEEYRIAGING